MQGMAEQMSLPPTRNNTLSISSQSAEGTWRPERRGDHNTRLHMVWSTTDRTATTSRCVTLDTRTVRFKCGRWETTLDRTSSSSVARLHATLHYLASRRPGVDARSSQSLYHQATTDDRPSSLALFLAIASARLRTLRAAATCKERRSRCPRRLQSPSRADCLETGKFAGRACTALETRAILDRSREYRILQRSSLRTVRRDRGWAMLIDGDR